MKHIRRKYIIAGIIVFVVFISALIFFRFFPIDKIWNIGSSGQKGALANSPVMSPAPDAYFYDFEVDPKTGNTSKLYEGIAHSGKYSVKAFGKNSYSRSIEKTVAEIGPGNLTAVSMSAWVYIFPGKNEPNGSFVFSANNELGANICWKGIHVSGPLAPRGKWFKISGFFDLSDVKFNPDSKILIYFWNNSSTDILVDDYYIVFGRQPARKGDSALVDMTRGVTFIPKFNYPPFPFVFLDKLEISGNQSVYLFQDKQMNLGELMPGDRIFPGHFYTGREMADDLLVIDKTGHPAGYLYCTSSDDFKNVNISLPPGFPGFSGSDFILEGSFISGGGSQLFAVKEDRMQLFTFDRLKENCSGSNLETGMKIIWSGVLSNLPGVHGKSSNFICADVNGDNSDEILVVSKDGSFSILSFAGERGSTVSIKSASGSASVDYWNSENNELKITPDKFLSPAGKDLLLTVSRNKKTGIYGYTLLRYESSSRNFISCFTGNKGGTGKQIGLDTLKPGDEFFTARTGADGALRIFRYSRDWRYELKEIRFNDSTFHTLANVDFTGFEKDHNPKYFEILRIVPGNYLAPGRTTFMVIGRNCRSWDQPGKVCKEFENRSNLPDVLQFYSYPEKQ